MYRQPNLRYSSNKSLCPGLVRRRRYYTLSPPVLDTSPNGAQFELLLSQADSLHIQEVGL